VIQFSLKEKARRVTIVPAETLKDVLRLTAQFENVQVIDELPVLLLELAEDEVNPRSYIPTYIPMSNRDVYSTTKELKKSGANYMLVDPPSCEDIQAMAVLEAKFSPENAVIKGDEEAVEKIVKERFDIVGPSLRSIFLNEARFNSLEESLIGQASLLFSNLDKVNVDNMPPNASMFLGAFVEPGVEIPSLTESLVKKVKVGSVRFLSNHIARLIAKVADEDKRRLLVSNLFDYQIAEEILCHGLMESSALIGDVGKWSYNDWSFFCNPA
jgi:tRNA pseudouridine-54 N-methylase